MRKETDLHLRKASDIPNDKEYVEALNEAGDIVFDVGFNDLGELEILFDRASSGMLIEWRYLSRLMEIAQAKLKE